MRKTPATQPETGGDSPLWNLGQCLQRSPLKRQAVKIRQVTQLDREGALEAGDAGAVRVKRQHLISLLDPQTFQTAFVAHQPPTGGNVLEANAS